MSPIIKPIWANSIWAYYKPDQFSDQVQGFINVRIPVIYIIEEACKLALGSSSFFKVIISIRPVEPQTSYSDIRLFLPTTK